MIFFTADTHFGHDAVIKMCGRPFENAGDMDNHMTENWNRKVKGNDTVYIIGDMFFMCSDPAGILRRLSGRKILITGNHDGGWTDRTDTKKYFANVHGFLEVSDGKRNLVLCHYPLMSWKHRQKSYMIHGHVHNRTDADYWPYIKNNERLLNAGADINGYAPVSFDELVTNNMRYKASDSSD